MITLAAIETELAKCSILAMSTALDMEAKTMQGRLVQA